MLTSRKRALAASVAVVAFSLAGVAAASPAAASGPVEPVPACTEANKDTLVCVTHGELGKEGVQTRVKVEEILCVRADVLMEKHGREDRSISETLDAKIYVPCKAPRLPEFENCDEATKVGVFDIPKSDPRYTKKLDDDNDGVACESVIESNKKPVKDAPKPGTVISDLPVTG